LDFGRKKSWFKFRFLGNLHDLKENFNLEEAFYGSLLYKKAFTTVNYVIEGPRFGS
jgi:hypothetical protein